MICKKFAEEEDEEDKRSMEDNVHNCTGAKIN